MSDWHPLDRRIRTVWTVSALVLPVILALLAAGLLMFRVPIVPWILGASSVVLITLALTFPAARWRSWGYLLTETELIIRFGVLIKVRRWLPRTRIQHVDIVGGPVERALGLRQIVIYTAGTREADVTVPGLRESDAEQLRADLLSWVESTAPPTPPPVSNVAGDETPETHDPEIELSAVGDESPDEASLADTEAPDR